MAAPEDLVVLTRDEGTSATIHLHGATLISWKCKNEERIFVSSKSLFNNEKAIRGGIPLVFPQFGAWECGPQHGFARISRWSLEQYPTKTAEGDVEVKLALVDNERTRAMWNHKFKLIYKVTLRESSLTTDLTVKNTGTSPFSFTFLLHTYIRVPDVHKVTVSGLQGCTYVDKVKGGKTETEENEVVRVSENVDRIYSDTKSLHEITNAAGGVNLKVSKINFPETVVWNPWEVKAREMSDFGDQDYLQMVCVEPGLVGKPISLAGDTSYVGSQTLSV